MKRQQTGIGTTKPAWRCRFIGGPLAGTVHVSDLIGRWLYPSPENPNAYELVSAVQSANPDEVHLLYRWDH